jgi:hypothetical protein
MEELTGERCSIPEHVYIFGSYAWAMVPGNDNVQERNLECMYLGPGGIVHKRGAMFVPLESIRNGQVKDNLFVTRRYKIYEDRDCGLDYMLEDWFVDSEDLGDPDYVPEQPEERVIQRAKRSNAQIQEDNEDLELKENGSDIENSGLRRSNRPKKPRSAENYYLIDLALIDVITVQEALESEDRKSWEEAINSEFKSIQEFGTYKVITQEELEEILESKELAGGKIFNTRLVLDRKRDGRFKARLVIQAYDYYDQIDVYFVVWCKFLHVVV